MSEGRLIDGKEIAATIRAEVRAKVELLRARGLEPGLTVVLVGDDAASQVYVRNKDKAAQEAGFLARTLRLPSATPQADLEAHVRALSGDRSVHGILVQLPLPKPLDSYRVVSLIDPAKDVDGLHPANVAALVMGRPGLRPCTPSGCIALCDRNGIALEGRHVVVLGRSMLVGKPFALMALERNATVSVCHSRTRDLPRFVRQADVLLAAVGRARLVQGDWIKPGGAVLDVGINRSPDGTLAGDVDFEAARRNAAWITPVPGGVGPMTVAMLLENTVLAAARQAGLTALLDAPPRGQPVAR